LKLNKAVGYKLDSAWQVINAILQERPPYSQWQTLYLIGIKAWLPTLNNEQAERVAEWRSEVLRSLDAEEHTYQRDRKYDGLLKLLFPEIATALSKSIGKSSNNNSAQSNNSIQGVVPPNTFSNLPNPWLRGRALETWKKNNPESAKQWEEIMPRIK
jgi:hypothetical protein